MQNRDRWSQAVHIRVSLFFPMTVLERWKAMKSQTAVEQKRNTVLRFLLLGTFLPCFRTVNMKIYY
jgi:hypothetical protein